MEKRNRISRRKFLATCAAAGAASSIGWKGAQSLAQAIGGSSPRRPNILLLVADDMRAETMGCAGNGIVRTPHLDSLAARGTLFRQSFATTAVCPSSRATILTGLYTTSHRIDTFDVPLSPRLFNNTYPMLLRKAGYRVGFVGKWGLGGELPEKSYDYFWGYPGQGWYIRPEYHGKHLTAIEGDHGVEFVRSCKKDQPFCLQVSFKAPHIQDEGRDQPGMYARYPYDPSLGWMYQKATIPPVKTRDAWPLPDFLKNSISVTEWAPDFYSATYEEAVKDEYRLISGLDIAVGRILDAIRETGATGNTVVIFTSDHGTFYGEHGFGGKWLMYEESIRSPLVICDPRVGRSLQGITCEEMMIKNDLVPTLLDLAGEPCPRWVQGRSLVPLVYGQKPNWRSEWFYEFRLTPPMPIAYSQGIRTKRWKYIRYVDAKPVREQLFDLKNDPREEKDLAAISEYRQPLAALRQRWQAWRTSLDGFDVRRKWADPPGGSGDIG